MKNALRRASWLASVILCIWAESSTVWAQATAFTYQGQLSSNGVPVNGCYDFTFALYNAQQGSTPIIAPATNLGIQVTNGLFTTLVDFGSSVFNGSSYWLEIGTRTNGGSNFVTLSPRGQITPTPYSIHAAVADNVAGTLPICQVPAMVLTNNAVDANLIGAFAGNFSGFMAGDGSGLRGVAEASLNKNRVRFCTYNSSRLPNFSTSGLHAVGMRQGFIASCDITNIAVIFPNFKCPGEIGATGTDASVTCAVEYPSNVVNRVLFNGQTNGIISNGSYVVSDFAPLAVMIPRGSIYWVRSFITNSGGILYYHQVYNSTGSNLWELTCELGDDLVDKTGVTGLIGTPQNESASTWGCCACLATNPNPVVAVLGDSRDAGQGDTDYQPQLGIDKLIGKYYGLCNLSAGGDSFPAANSFWIWSNRVAIANAYADYVVSDLGINSWDNATLQELFVNDFASHLAIPLYVETLTPETTSIDNWTTFTGQRNTAFTPPYNAALRNKTASLNIAGYIDVAAVLSLDSGLWKVNGSPNAYTFDGIHPDCYDLIARSFGDPLKTGSAPLIPASNIGLTTNISIAGTNYIFVGGVLMGATPAN